MAGLYHEMRRLARIAVGGDYKSVTVLPMTMATINNIFEEHLRLIFEERIKG